MDNEQESNRNLPTPEGRLGSALRRIRMERGMPLRALARKLYRSHSTLVEYERGHRLAPLEVVQAYESEFGVAPGTLVELYEAAKRQLYGEDRSRRQTYVLRPVPDVALQQLPADIAEFTGREAELARLRAVVGEPGRRGASPVVISAIAGMGGVGKTALALHLAHELAPAFPDAQLYIDLHGYEPSQRLSPGQALDRFLRALGVAPELLPTALEEQASRYRTLLAGKRALVLLDNASSAEQVRPLLPGAATCLVLVTSRGGLTGLVAREGARLLTLDVLAPEESLELLARVAGRERVDAEPEAAAEAVRRCGYLPLAVRILAAKLAARPRMRVAELVGRLANEERSLGHLTAGEVEVRASFALSYTELAPDVARTFRRLGLIAGPDFTAGAVAALATTTVEQAEAHLEVLLDAHLIEDAPIAGRYRFHDLLRLYARERVQAEEPDDERTAALRRLLQWYLDMADAAGRLLIPARHRLPYEGRGELPTSIFPAQQSQLLDWFEAELPNLVAATEQAADGNFYPTAWQLPDALWSFLYLRRHFAYRRNLHAFGLAAARSAGNLQAEAWMLTSLGGVYGQSSEFEQAIQCLERAIAICAEIGDPWGGARALHFRGLAELGMNRFVERSRGTPGAQMVDSLQGVHGNGSSLPRRPSGVLAFFEKALKISQDIGDLYRQGRLMSNVGEVYWRLGRLEQAIECLEQGLAMCRKIGDHRGLALALYNLAEVNRNRGRLEEAIDYYREALVIRRDIRDPWGEARVLQSLGLALQRVEGAAAARACWQKALAIFSQLGEPEAEEVRAYLLAVEGAPIGEK